MAVGQKIRIICAKGERIIEEGDTLTRDELWRIAEAAAGGTLFSCQSQICRGYLSLAGGYRLGLCGSVNIEGEKIRSFGDISSICIRAPHAVIGCADNLPELFSGEFQNTLIIAPPAVGKTSLLREIVRVMSTAGTQIGLADERSEVAALRYGVPELDVGEHTDIMDGAPKALAVMSLLRCMSPQIIALDEISERADISACTSCFGCGVKILATAHGKDVQDLYQRPLYRELLEQKIFDRAVVISRESGKRKYEVVAL